ncbi:RIO1 family regulatory kinase/ATPase domain-containing protein [Anaeromyxobacter paludicola]|uniref:non-specific serine/threonine protein kinase n=1 Tax=Anaeromyxobacter paludicola TaxID=2918171 RepID=A0ABM7XFM8_9BACT|nr:RIO1 family regulatory kinase/ATPase [Anaeromyxobacter paludicola]BDG10712.1 hypothetical protein AMPC_38250 [Anaeromyxobacter paludicola]
MNDPLQQLLADGVIDQVVARLKSGKEADIWLVQHGSEVVAAKVYKDLHARNFRNNAAYKEGRQVRDSRTQRAMDRGSRFGQQAAEEAWKAKESDALHQLHAAGVRVPRPVMFYEGVLLMEAVVDAEGHAAPRLVETAVPPERAAEWYADLRQQVVRMLCCDLIHGDLSPYNVLLAWNGPTVIDFPQVVGAAHNSQAERFFERDLETIRRFFAPLDPAVAAAAGDAREIWRAYVRRELTPDFVPTGRLPPEPARHGRHERHGGRSHERDRKPHGGRHGGPQPHAGGKPAQSGAPQGGGRAAQSGPQRGAPNRPAQPTPPQTGAPNRPAQPPSPPRGEGRGGAARSTPQHHGGGRPAHSGPRGAPSRPAQPPQAGAPNRPAQPTPPQSGAPSRPALPPSPPRGEGRGGAARSTPQPHAGGRPAHPGPHRGQQGRPAQSPSPPAAESRGGAARSAPPPHVRRDARGGPRDDRRGGHPPRPPRREPPGPLVTYVTRPPLSPPQPKPPGEDDKPGRPPHGKR